MKRIIVATVALGGAVIGAGVALMEWALYHERRLKRARADALLNKAHAEGWRFHGEGKP